MKTFLRVVGGVVVLSAVALLTTGFLQGQNADEQDISIADEAEVEVQNLTLDINATGVVTPIREASLTFGLVGPVEEVLVREGDYVQAGDVIATLDNTDLELSRREAEVGLEQQRSNLYGILEPARDVDIAVAEANLYAAQAGVWAAYATAPTDEDEAIAELDIDIARNQVWQAQLRRDETLETPEEFRNVGDSQNARAQEYQLENAIDAAESGVNIAETQFERVRNAGPTAGASTGSVTQAEIQLENLLAGPDANDIELAAINYQSSALSLETLDARLADGQIVAPFSGIITDLNLDIGELPPAQGGVTLADTSEFYVEINVDEDDVIDVSVGQAVSLRLDALPEANITGEVTYLALSPQVVAGTSTYLARVSLAPTEEPVKAGMSATATIVTAEITDAYVLPTQFVRPAGNGGVVTVLDADGNPTEVRVEIGRQSDVYTQILSGLEPGRRVVLLGEPTETE